MARAAEILSGAKEVALACHVNPDTDALGSMLGLSIVLRSRGAHTMSSFANEPFEVPRWAGVLAGTEALIPPATFPKEPEVMVTCDAASLDRLGSLGANAARAHELIWIDHHVSNEGLGTIPLIDPSASSTCEMVFRLVKAMGGDLPDEAAMCLYAGLVTDTRSEEHTSELQSHHDIVCRLLLEKKKKTKKQPKNKQKKTQKIRRLIKHYTI